MRRLLCFAAALCLASCAVAQAPVPHDAGFSAEIDGIASELSAISGLKPHGRIQTSPIPRSQVKQFLEQRTKETVKPREIQAEDAALKKLGFVPPDFDLKKATIDLLSEQASAFYDFRKKRLFLVASGSLDDLRMALVHEIAHALADQHFNLNRYTSHGDENDDDALARLAVMEGQATWLASEYSARQRGQSLKDSPALAGSVSSLLGASSADYPVFDRSPLYLRETLLFPYAQGMLFQQALVEKMGRAAFAEPFRHPPESTQQILHPEKYLQHVHPVRPPLPALRPRRAYRSFTGGELGELDYAILLRQYVGKKESSALAPEWRGGFFRLFERKRRPRRAEPPDWRRMVLACSSQWNGPEPARRYFELYQKVLAGKWKTFEATSRSPDEVAGRGDDGYFLLRLEGDRVTSLEGLPSPDAAEPRP
jgi:hypothetical protein